MAWENIAISGFAAIVGIIAFSLSMLGLVRLAALLDWVQRWERTERMTPSDRAELLELRDAMTKANNTLKRVNSRLAMQHKKGDDGLIHSAVPTDPAQLKAYLRQKAGLTTVARAKKDQ